MKAIQLRMARAALGWGVRELAEKAGVTANTVTRIENGADAKQSTIDRLQHALEAAGVEFTNSDQPGVRLKAAAAGSLKGASGSKPAVAAKAVRGKTAKAYLSCGIISTASRLGKCARASRFGMPAGRRHANPRSSGITAIAAERSQTA